MLSNNLSQLEQLQPEIAIEGVAPNLDNKDIANAILTSKKMYELFAPVSATAKLLHFVIGANYAEAKKLITANPELMFKYVSYKKPNGSYEIISPLKFAFKNLDTTMWKMFLEIIIGCKNIYILENFPQNLEKYKNCSLLVSGQLYSVDSDGSAKNAKAQNSQLLTRFAKHLEEQKNSINLEPLFAEYKACVAEFDLWVQGQISDQAIDTAWLKVGMKQRELLPQHMMREFCRNGNSWAESNFDLTVDPRPIGSEFHTDTEIHNYNIHRKVTLKSLLANSGLGLDFTLVRGESLVMVAINSLWKVVALSLARQASFDCDNFRHLYEVRAGELDSLRSQLNLPYNNGPEMMVLR